MVWLWRLVQRRLGGSASLDISRLEVDSRARRGQFSGVERACPFAPGLGWREAQPA